MSVPATFPPAARHPRRTTAVDRLLDGLDALVARHRALTSADPGEQRLHTELIGAELAHAIVLARAELRRPPLLSVVDDPAGPR